LSSWCAASNAAPMPATADGGVVIQVVRWGWLSSTTVVASVRPPARHDRPALEREVVSPPSPVSLSRREGWEEAATEWTSTMVMKLKTKNDKKKPPLPGALNVKVVLRHFHRHCYSSSPLWFFVWKGLSSLGC
jgi:hypothetical protein